MRAQRPASGPMKGKSQKKGPNVASRVRQTGEARYADGEISASDQTRKNKSSPKTAGEFPIAGVGASAGGLEAFSELLKKLPAHPGLGLVLVQHLDPSHQSILSELLARCTAMPVREAKDRMPVEPDSVYVIPPNATMKISGGRLRIAPGEKLHGRHHDIDIFLQSLAKDCGPRAIGVVLSGSDEDGTRGLEAIKNEGGFTFAQDEESAAFDRMPRSAVAGGHVDRVLPPAKIARELTHLARSLSAPNGRREINGGNGLKKILDLLRSHCGVDFEMYKASTIQRRIQRRMMLHRINRAETYFNFLRDHPKEIETLYGDVLVNTTGFFREPEVFQTLGEKVFPQLVRKRAAFDPVRVWGLGCSTGQELGR